MNENPVNEIINLPLLPLRGLNVFPGMLLTFDVERPASVAALSASVKRSSLIFLSAQKDMAVDAPEEKDIYRVGVVCRVRQQLRQPRANVCRVMVEGLYRAEALEMTTDGKYATARVVNLPDKPERVRAERKEALVRNCLTLFGDYLHLNPDMMNEQLLNVISNPLENKTAAIAENLRLTQNNWEESFYYTVAQSFGFKTNAQPFLMLAQSLPLNVIAHHKNSLTQVEALLFGQAGLLPAEPADAYTQLLAREYSHLKIKYRLEPIPSNVWKFARMRPGNLPTVRIAQLASLISKSSALLSKIIECQSVDDVKHLFATNVSDYWLTHYVFEKPSARKDKNLGDASLNLLVINAFVPFMFHYGKSIGKTELTDRALQWLEDVPAEKNTIISQWEKFGIEAKCALESQALIELANCYCQKKQCLKCRVGRQVMVVQPTDGLSK